MLPTPSYDECYAFRLTVTSELPADVGHIPMSPTIDFGERIAQAGLPGVLDPNSIQVVDLTSGQVVPHARTEDLSYGDRGRIEWVIRDPAHKEYEIRFKTAETRPRLEPQSYVPMIGTGDLLRYNAGMPRPITMFSSMRLLDMTGDGRQDLVGCWNYYHRPGSPVSGVICYPRVGPEEAFTFGDLTRLHYVEEPGSGELHDFPGVYIEMDLADLTGNGLLDMVFAVANSGEVTVYLNTGRRELSGMPIFIRDRSIPAPVGQSNGLCAVDLNGDGAVDLVVNGQYIQNTNPAGWPFEPALPVRICREQKAVFVDLDGNGRLDMVSLKKPEKGEKPYSDHPHAWCGQRLLWSKRVSDDPPAFADPVPLQGIEADTYNMASAVTEGAQRGLLVQHNMYQNLSLYQVAQDQRGAPRLEHRARMGSISAVMSLSDQAWPCICDWNGNGVSDLLIGGGYGWPRVAINQGSNERPAFAEPELIFSEGKPIRILRDEVLSSHHWHNMGYPYPVFVDWTGNGLRDLMLPNETNRILWYENTGTQEEPRFGPRQFLEVDGFPDSDELRAHSGRKGEDKGLPNHPYPRDENTPFFWRTGAAFADWNGDGLTDLITHDYERKATLFVQCRDGTGQLRLRREGHVRLADGRVIDDSIVGRTQHWTESFRAVDWDGDGLIDLIYSLAATGQIYLLRNVGSKQAPLFAPPREFKCYGEPIGFTIHGPNAWAGDLNGDGKPDLLGCVEWSVYPFFCHAALEMERAPNIQLGPVRVVAPTTKRRKREHE